LNQSSSGARLRRLRSDVRRFCSSRRSRAAREGLVARRRFGREALAQPLQRQLAVARLTARILGDRCDALAELLLETAALLGGERGGSGDVEYRLDPGSGDVRVLPAGTG
jgi:hypothetical protein